MAAFARSAHGQTVLIAAPVQIATLTRGAVVAPMGQEVWRDHTLSIQGDSARVYRDVFTGRVLEARSQNGKAALKLAEVFGQFPVAALLAD